MRYARDAHLMVACATMNSRPSNGTVWRPRDPLSTTLYRALRTGALALACLVVLAPANAHADEGQWMPEQIAELDADKLRAMGLTLEARELWNPGDGGLMAAVVNFGGCSAGFVSKHGLIATNHHCAYGAIQSQSTVENDYLTHGFLAKAQADELEAKGRTVRVLNSITDVTAQIAKVSEQATDDAMRARAVEQIGKQLVKDCEAKGDGITCAVASFYNGSRYQLFEAIELRDIRLVYAPASGVGNFGGEVDNWMWPRHSGDFTLLRAYVGPDGKPADHAPDNVPYQPKRWLTVGHEGVAPGDFVAVLGYPGRTHRYLPAPEIERELTQVLPTKIALYGAWIDILERAGAADKAVKIKVASKLRRLANRHKNARGMIAGVERIGLLDRRKREDEALAAWAKNQPGDRYQTVLDDLRALTDARRADFLRSFLLSSVRAGANGLAIAFDVVRSVKERQKPDLERKSMYMDRDRKRLWSRQQLRLRDFDRDVDTALLDVFLQYNDKLPKNARLTNLVNSGGAAAIVRATKVGDADFVKGLFDAGDWKAIESSRDPLIALARDIVAAAEAQEQVSDQRKGQMLIIGPRYFEMLKAVRKGPVYPDANGTLRFSYASIKGYSPKDGLTATPQTTLAGQVRKHTGEEPFDLPQAVLDAAEGAPGTYWSDPELGDVPVCFLSTGDTTGGNSGSPMIDGKGRWIGLNFDRVWENIAGDFGYHMSRSRNIGVDVRYLLWSLDRVVDGTRILEELGVADKRKAAPRARAPKATAGATPSPEPCDDDATTGAPATSTAEKKRGCGCRIGAREHTRGDRWAFGSLVMAALGAMLWMRRRRRHAVA